MKKNKAILPVLIALTILMLACTQKFEEMNTNPNTLTQVTYKSLITNAENSILREYVTYGTGVVSWAMYNVRDVYVHEDRYKVNGEGYDFSFYTDHMESLKIAMEKAALVEDNNTIAVAKILTAYAYQNNTDWFGDIPYSEALQADAETPIIFPKYDSQESIYTDLIVQLKAANAMIDPTKSIGNADIIFQGDMMKWKKFANSLLLRVYMRMSRVKPDIAKAGIEEIIANPETYPIISSNLDNVFKYWIPGDQNYRSPYWQKPENKPVLENVSCDFMINFVKDRNDERLFVYADPAQTSGEYVGLPLGTLGQNTPDLSTMGFAEFYSEISPSRVMRYSEVLFILAEAALNGWNVGMTAQEAYEAAITASFGEYGLDIGSYLSEPLVDFNGGTPQRELIGDQKWIALYPDGNQGWAEIRRTGFPTYVNTTEPVGSAYPGNGVVKRKPYPYTEAITNPDNLAAAKAAQPGIVDEKFGAGVWWDID